MASEEITFGSWIRSKRRELDLSRQALADDSGCAEISIRRIEAGTLKPSKELAGILLRKFGVPEAELDAWIRFARGSSGFPTKPEQVKPDSPPSFLPTFLTKFIGREKEQVEVTELVRKNRLVTFIGPGGVGKTRLSGIIGEKLSDDYPNGAFMVELASLNDPGLLPQVVALPFGLEAQSQFSFEELLVNYLRKKKVLLIFDNCEHLLSACAQLAETLLKNCPDLKILATSRESLKVTGEALYHVPSLAIPEGEQSLEKFREAESIRLFEERAKLTQPDFELTMENIQSAVLICRVMDGIPLAIELAAARVDIFSLEQLASRIRESMDLLTGGSRTALPRQQTIRGSIDWSWDLLSEKERLFFCRLSVFSGGWTLEAAEEVCSGEGIEVQHVPEYLSRLAAKSLVMVNRFSVREKRYGLHELIRQYAQEKMISDEDRFVRTNHLRYYVKLSKEAEPALMGPEQLEWRARLNLEQDNLRSALDWAAKTNVEAGMHIIGRLDNSFGSREGIRRVLDFLEKDESHQYPLARARALLALSGYLWNIQQFIDSRRACEESLKLFRAHGDKDGEFYCLIQLGAALQFLEGMDKKIEIHEQALALAREIDDLPKLALAMSVIGWDRNHPRSLEYWDEAIKIYRQLGYWQRLAHLLAVYGDTLLLNGETDAAQALLEESEILNEKIQDKWTNEFLLVARSREAIQAGEFDKARAYLQKWLGQAEELGNRMGYLWGRARLGYVILLEGSLEEGAEILCKTAREFNKDQNLIGLAFTFEKMAYFFIMVNQHDLAVHLIGWANKTREEKGELRLKLEQIDIDKIIATCTSHLGVDAVTIALNHGSALSMKEMVDMALKEC